MSNGANRRAERALQRVMDEPFEIPNDLERRLSGLAAGPAVPTRIDSAVLADAEKVLAMRKGNGGAAGWRGVAAAAVIGVVAGVIVVGGVAQRNSGGVDMVDAFRAARAGGSADEVRRIEAAAVRVGKEPKGVKGGGS